MVNAQRTVHSVTVSWFGPVACVTSMTPIAHVVRSKTMKHSHVATEHALPVDLLFSVRLANILAASDLI